MNFETNPNFLNPKNSSLKDGFEPSDFDIRVSDFSTLQPFFAPESLD